MPECPKCHSQVRLGENYCPECGQDMRTGGQYAAPDEAGGFDAGDVQSNKMIAVLSYFGLLVLVPLLAAPRSKFARFHANQGLVLFLSSAILQVLCRAWSHIVHFLHLPSFVGSAASSLVGLVTFILMILGIINAVNGAAKELPLIGKFRLLK